MSTSRPELRRVLGHDGKSHLMTLRRKAGHGVGNFRSVTRKMSADCLGYIRQRAKRTTYEARQRELILNDPFKSIAESVLVNKQTAATKIELVAA